MTDMNQDLFYSNKEYGLHYHDVSEICNFKDGDVFIDFGANLGQEIEYFSKLNLNIHSYEPHPYFFNKLSSKFSSLENVTLNNIAVADKNYTAEFFFKKNPSTWDENFSCGGASLERKTNHDPAGSFVEVPCIDVANILNKFDSIKILKMDVEGTEYKILRRMIETDLLEKPDFIFLEDHQRKIIDLDSFLSDKKFVCEHMKSIGKKFYMW